MYSTVVALLYCTVQQTVQYHKKLLRPFLIIHSFIHSSIHSSIYPFIHSSIHPFIHSSIHPFIHSSIHSFIHSFIMPRRKSKQPGGNMPLTYNEQKKVASGSSYGTCSSRLTSESQVKFGDCCLGLTPAVDPVVTKRYVSNSATTNATKHEMYIYIYR